MKVFRLIKCDFCEGLGATIEDRYAATSHLGYDEYGLTIEKPLYIGRSWKQKCRPCAGHGEILRIYSVGEKPEAKAA